MLSLKLALWWAVLNSPPPISNEQVLDAIRIVESGGDDLAVSHAGASGPYGILKSTWEDRTDRPYSEVFNPTISRQVAQDQLEWLNATLTAWKGSASLEEILAAYNGGIGRLRRNQYNISRMPKESREYVTKVLGVINEGQN